MRARLLGTSLVLALLVSAFAWGPVLWLLVTTESVPMQDLDRGLVSIAPIESLPWDDLSGKRSIHRWSRNAQGQPELHGPFWIYWEEAGELFLTGDYENDEPVRITQYSRAGDIVAQARFTYGSEPEIELREGPPWWPE